MLIKHQPDSKSELSVFIKTPQGQVLSSAKACATLINNSSSVVREFANQNNYLPEATLNVHLSDQVISLELFGEDFAIELIRDYKPGTAPDLSHFSLRTYLWVCAGFDADAIIQSIVSRTFDNAEATVSVNNGGITPAGIQAIYQQEVE
ncbi:MAG: hypothetical protein F6K50_03280 [Moorea sp. SIO3I7]|uniref:hypothetical protein n=1 Tax=Moorena sp. SIO3I8 TaxID=2607833 RepID=UPI0013BF8695|nr:hypothetical protein [Moorena sp. SIO3I8]NEN94583.1 hypothetical protein [Moorena sp. SIO3I7]NEO07822.1 hypothetical protein [Moorena sp. SIO3I8]